MDTASGRYFSNIQTGANSSLDVKNRLLPKSRSLQMPK